MQQISKRLDVADHSRDITGMTYVYPVISRRAGGVSIGINLNPNNACNWRCIYCQVPNLSRGAAPAIDLAKLEVELRALLHEIVYGDFMQRQVPAEARCLHDIALSGNGESTSAGEFEQVIELLGRVKADYDLPGTLKLVLITNGSLIDRDSVQRGLSRMATFNGEVWFKLDSVTREGRQLINNTRMSLKKMRRNLQLSAFLCPTWLQTCVFQIDGMPPSRNESEAYLRFIEEFLSEGGVLEGVLLYGLARPSLQPEGPRLTKIREEWMEAFSEQIRRRGLAVKLNP